MDHVKISGNLSSDPLDNVSTDNMSNNSDISVLRESTGVSTTSSSISIEETNDDYDKETLFWYNILYTIGSHVIDNAKRLQDEGIINENSNKYKTSNKITSEVSLDDPLTKIFCGYWILYTIATASESTNTHDDLIS